MATLTLEFQGTAASVLAAIGKIEVDLKRLEAAVQATSRSFEKVEAASRSKMGGAATGIQIFSDTVDKADRSSAAALGNVEKNLGKLPPATKQAQSAFEKFGEGVSRSLENAGKSMVKFTLALGALGVGLGLREAIRFEAAMANVNVLLDKGSDQAEKMNAGILRIAGSSTRSATELSGGLIAALRSGIPAIEGAGGALELVDKAQQAARVGGAETAEVVQALSRVYNTYGAAAGTFGQVSEKLVQIYKDSNLELPDLARQLGKTAEAGKDAGLSFDQTAAALALVGKVLPSRQAFSAVVGLFEKLSSGEESKAFKKLGIDVTKARLESQGLVPVLQEIITKTGGNQAVMQKLLGSTVAVKTAFILTAQGGQKLADETQRIANANGNITEALKIQGATVEAAGAGLRNAFELKSIEAFSDKSGELSGVINDLTNDVKHFDPKPFLEGISGIIVVLEVLAKILIGIVETAGKASTILSGLPKAPRRYATDEAGNVKGSKGILDDYLAPGAGIMPSSNSIGSKIWDAVAGNGVAAGTTDQMVTRIGRNSLGGAAPWQGPLETLLGPPSAAAAALPHESDAARRAREKAAKDAADKLNANAKKAGADAKKAESELLKINQDYYKSLDALRKVDLANAEKALSSELVDVGATKERALDLAALEADAETALARDARQKRDKEIEENAPHVHAIKDDTGKILVTREERINQAYRESYQTLINDKKKIDDQYQRHTEDIEDKVLQSKRGVAEKELAIQRHANEVQALDAARQQVRNLLLTGGRSGSGYADREALRASAFSKGGLLGLAGMALQQAFPNDEMAIKAGGLAQSVGEIGVLPTLGAMGVNTALGGISRIVGDSGPSKPGENWKEGAGDVFLGAVEMAGAKFGSLVQEAGSYLADQFSSLISEAGSTAPGKFATEYGAGAAGKFAEAAQFLLNLQANLKQLLIFLPGFIKYLGTELVKAIPVVTAELVKYMPAVVDALLAQAPRIMQALVNAIPDLMNLVGQQGAKIIGSLIVLAANSIGPIIAAFVAGAGRAIGNIIADTVKGKGLLQGDIGEYTKQGALYGSVIPGVGTVGGAVTGAVAGLASEIFSGFAEGGMVSGPIGRAQIAKVHGGEGILHTGATRAIGGSAAIEALNRSPALAAAIGGALTGIDGANLFGRGGIAPSGRDIGIDRGGGATASPIGAQAPVGITIGLRPGSDNEMSALVARFLVVEANRAGARVEGIRDVVSKTVRNMPRAQSTLDANISAAY